MESKRVEESIHVGVSTDHCIFLFIGLLLTLSIHFLQIPFGAQLRWDGSTGPIGPHPEDGAAGQREAVGEVPASSRGQAVVRPGQGNLPLPQDHREECTHNLHAQGK